MNYKSLLASIIIGAATLTAQSQARYVFYFIGDGMGISHVNAANLYNRTVLGNESPLLMLQFPVITWAESYSASSPVTDSAAAGTALASGHKTRNSMIGMGPDSIPVTSIATTLKNRGWGVGVFTSVPLDDATPAAFYAHQINRGMNKEIDRDAAHSRFDILGGGYFRGASKPDGLTPGETKMFNDNGYTVVYGTKNIPDNAKKLLVLDPRHSHDIGYTIDSIPGAMTLEELTQTGIDHLMKQSPDSFFIMIEGGAIDHAGHANDAATVVSEIIAYQDAIRHAYDFYLQHPDETLIVVTADHNTGGLAIRDKRNLATLGYQGIFKDSFADMIRHMVKDEKKSITWPQMQTILKERVGLYSRVPVNEKTDAELQKLFNDNFIDNNGTEQRELYNTYNGFITRVFELMNEAAGIDFIHGSHTGDPVPVMALGKGAEAFRYAHNNTDIPKLILRATEK